MSSRLPPEFFNKLDPTYQSKILLLECRLNSTENPDKKQEYLDSFYENFLMPGEFIDEMLKQRDEYFIDMGSTYRRYCQAFSKATKKKVCEMMNEDVKTRADHFYFLYYYSDTILGKSIYACSIMENKLQDRSDSDLLEQKTVEYVEERLRYPHENMNENLIQYECLSSNPIPQSLIEKSKEMYNLYQQIKEANDDYEEWIKLLSSVNDHEFLKNTVEIRIGKNLTDKKLWKAYIKYLESYNVKEMLQVYSKYCRFFLDDVEMLKEYLEKGKQHGSIEVIWKPQYSFELQCIQNYDPSWKKNFAFEAVSQQFSFRKPFIKYITSTANPLQLQKLQQSCKLFFTKRPILICHRFIVQYSIDYYSNEQELKFDGSSMRTLGDFLERNLSDKKFHITNSLDFKSFQSDYLSKLILQKRIYKCSAKFLYIIRQTLKESDWNFLVNHGNVEYLNFCDTTIVKEDGFPLMLDEMMTKLLKLQLLEFGVDERRSLPRQYKFRDIRLQKKLNIWEIWQKCDNIDPDDFCLFVKNNAAPGSSFRLDFPASDEKKQQIRDKFAFYMASWDLPGEKPCLKVD